MEFIYVLIGFFGGILGGMGMGGGTILIPLLTTFLGLYQKQAQFLNIFSFIFMSAFIVTYNIKQKFTDPFPAIIFSLPGIVSSIISSLLVKNLPESFLKIAFGVFLIILSVVQLVFLLSKKNGKSSN